MYMLWRVLHRGRCPGGLDLGEAVAVWMLRVRSSRLSIGAS